MPCNRPMYIRSLQSLSYQFGMWIWWSSMHDESCPNRQTTKSKTLPLPWRSMYIQSSNMWSTPWKVQLLCPPSEASLHKRLFVLTHDWLHCTTYYYECNTVVPWRLQRKLNKRWKFQKNTFSKDFVFFEGMKMKNILDCSGIF